MEQTLIEAKYHNYLIKSNRRLMILYGFALLLTYPLLLFFSKNLVNLYDLAIIGKTLNVLLAIVGSVLIPLLMYRHTTTKKSIDVYDALPLQKESMFRIHFFAGFIILIFPLLISFLVGFIYIISNPQPNILLNSYYNNFTLSNELLRFIELSIGLLASYSITTFVKQNCGTSIDALIYTIVVHLTPILTYLAFYSYCSSSLLGFKEPFSTNLFLYLTPIPMMFTYFDYTSDLVSTSRLIFFIVLSILLYIFSSYLYVNHKSERAETPFMNKCFFPFVSYIITIVAMILLHAAMQYSVISILNNVNQFIYPMLLGCVFYLVLDVIAHRGFAHILKATINFLLIATIVMGILLPINATQGFGYVTHVPDSDSVESVTITIPYSLSDIMDCDRMVEITDKETISKLIEYHQWILEEYSHYQYSTQLLEYTLDSNTSNTYPFDFTTNYTETISFEYNNKVGTISRQYSIPSNWTYPLTQLVTSPSFNKNRIQTILPNEEDQKLSAVHLTQYFNQFKENNNILSYGFNFNVFRKHLEADLNSLSSKEFFENSGTPYGILQLSYETDSTNQYTYIKQIEIKECYQTTINYLKELGIPIDTDTFIDREIGTVRLVYPSTQDTVLFHMLCNNYSCFYDTKETEHKYKYIPIDMLDVLLPYLQSTAMFEENGLILTTDNYGSFILSPECSTIIDELTKDIPFSGTILSYEFK